MALAWTSDNIAKILSGEIKATTPTATPTTTAKPTSGFGSSTGNGIEGYDKYGSGITPEMQDDHRRLCSQAWGWRGIRRRIHDSERRWECTRNRHSP